MAIPNIFASGMSAFDDQTQRLNQFAAKSASQQAGAAIAGGDYQGGADVLNRAGMIDQAHNVVADQQVISDRKAASDQAVIDRQQKAKQIQIEGLSKIVDAMSTVPEGHRAEWLKPQIPLIQQLGYPTDGFSNMDESHLTNSALAPLRSLLEKAKEDYNIDGVRYSGTTNKPIAGVMQLDPHKVPYGIGDAPQGGTGGLPSQPSGQSSSPAPPGPPPPPDPNGASVQSVAPQMVWRSIKQQESGGQASPGTAVGPDTQYGNALGSTQMLPQTAQAMAAKTGTPWRPDLLQSNSPEALAYQDRLGQAYFQEGLQKYGGDVTKAAMYYYGGPDEKLWGPKTHAYAQQVIARAGVAPGQSGAGTLQGTAGSDTPPAPQAAPYQPPQIPGFHPIGAAKPEWQDMDSPDHQRNTITGETRGKSPDADETPITPKALDLLVGTYVKTMQVPAFGQGKVGSENRAKFFNRLGDYATEHNLTADDIVTGAATIKAAMNTLKAFETTTASIRASESAVLKNADLVLNLAPKGAGPTGIPLANAPIQYLRDKVWGSEQVASFNNVIGTTADEYAKVMSTTTGSGGVTSDSARAEAYSRLSKAATVGQLRDVITKLHQEMDNKSTSWEAEKQQEIHAIRSTNSGLPQDGPPKTRQVSIPGATPEQNAALSNLPQIAGQAGTQTNPLVPRSEAEYRSVKPGQWYVHHSGQIVQKKAAS